MKLSIIIPVKDGKDFIERCLNSVEKQLTDEVECIVIDDGSTDGTTEILKEYVGKKGFGIYRQDKSRGVSDARNAGITFAKGEYITFLDSDDEYVENAIKKMLNTTAQQKDIVQFNQLRHYDETGKTMLRYTNPTGTYSLYCRPQMWCMVWNKIYRTKFLKDNHIWFKTGMQFGEDEHFNLKCMLADATYWHTKEATVIKHFDNKNSLCHKITSAELHKQDDVLTSLYWGMIYLNDLDKATNGNKPTEMDKRIKEVEGIIKEHRASRLYQQTGLRKADA